ncbi:MAG: hypothetical protein MRJ52_03230 [Nitrosomonas sp.]|nr:hypothetical protein [Nitrosomonas sp.]
MMLFVPVQAVRYDGGGGFDTLYLTEVADVTGWCGLTVQSVLRYVHSMHWAVNWPPEGSLQRKRPIGHCLGQC